MISFSIHTHSTGVNECNVQCIHFPVLYRLCFVEIDALPNA